MKKMEMAKITRRRMMANLRVSFAHALPGRQIEAGPDSIEANDFDPVGAFADQISAGMLVSAEVNLGSRTVMAYLLSRVQKVTQEAGREM